MNRTCLAVAILLSAAACTPAAETTTMTSPATSTERPAKLIANVVATSVAVLCHEGRAVYVTDGSYSGGVFVVPNAPECAQTEAETHD